MRLVTLIDLGAGALPAQTPAPARFARWFPVVHLPAIVPPVDGAGATPVADGVLLEWDAVDSGGAEVIYIVERSLSSTGPWKEIARTTATRYLYSDGSGQTWFFRIIPTVRGQAGPSGVIEGVPNPVTARLVEIQMAADQAVHDAALAELNAAQALALMGEEYDPSRGYFAEDMVYLSGKMYRAVQPVPVETPPPNYIYWADVGTVTQAQSDTSSALSQLRVDVDEQGDEFAAAITTVSNGLANLSIENIAPDPNIELGTSQWGFGFNPGGYDAPAWNIPSAEWMPRDANALVLYKPGTVAVGSLGTYVTKAFRVEPNVRYSVSGYLWVNRTNALIGIHFYNQAGGFIEEWYAPAFSTDGPGPTSNLSVFTRRNFFVDSPADAWTAQYVFRSVSRGNDPVGRLARIMVAKVSATATEAPPWIGSDRSAASATIAVKVAQDAQITHATDVNGNISGTYSVNDGVRSSYSILATVFRVVSNLTGMGMEWLDGYLRIWRGSAQLVLGHTFGSGDLVMWYGPNVGAGNCSRSNGLFYLDTDGGGYFGGALSAGALKNAVQTTNTATSGVELVNGPFSTNGKVRNVVVSYSRNQRRVKNAAGTDGFVAGAGSNTAVVQVYRKIGDAAETLWQTINVSGTVDIRNEPDTADVAISTWGGSLTVNDTSPSTSLIQYRAVLSAFMAQTVTHQSGSFESQTVSQNLSIISVES